MRTQRILLPLLMSLLVVACAEAGSSDHDTASELDQTVDLAPEADSALDTLETADELDPDIEQSSDITEEDVADSTPVEWLTEAQLSEIERQEITVMRLAIDKGLFLGKGRLGDEFNRVLGQEGIAFTYQPSMTEYVAAGQGHCPFASGTPTPTDAVSCRAISDRAKVAAYSQLSSLQTQNPLDGGFDNNREDNEFWYGQGIMTGFDNEAILAIRLMRELELCDVAPTIKASAYESGVELGRHLYIRHLNQRLSDTGNPMDYPTDIRPIAVCQADQAFLAPARSSALAAAPAESDAVPLCVDWTPSNVDEINQYNEATTQYRKGIDMGIASEHSLANERVFRIVNCNVSDPVIFDMMGDGIHLRKLSQGVPFDLFGWNEPVQTSWIQGDDALLALDTNGNGRIDNGHELFVNFIVDGHVYRELESGFDNLARYDTADFGGNNDGRIDSSDQVFGSLLLWHDHNADGVSQRAELSTLLDNGIRSIDLCHEPAVDENLGAATPSHIRERVRFLRDNGRHGYAYEVWFSFGKARR